MKKKNIVIITAGGKGLRLSKNQKKQFMMIAGKTILEWTIEPFIIADLIDEIIITLPPEDLYFFQKLIQKQNFPIKITCIKGGKERQESVFNALKMCPTDTYLIAIHDGVRPFVTQEEIFKLFSFANVKKAVIPVTKVKYTLKEGISGVIKRTVAREDIYEAHTPQVFSYDLIWKYHQKATDCKHQFTDDASILEYFGIPVYYKETSYQNIKITQKEDYKLAKLMIEK